MPDNFPWPKKGNKAFIQGNGERDFQLPQFYNDPKHGRTFMDAADALMETYQSMTLYRDDFFYPIAYLYRHGLELLLKDLVRLGLDLRFFDEEAVSEMLEGHSLYPLWNKARLLIQDRWPNEDPSPIKGTEAIISQFHQADTSGQAFRYAIAKSGQWHNHTTLPKTVGLDNMRESMKGVHSFLSCCLDGIAGRSQISIATGGRVFLVENFEGCSEFETCAGSVVE